MIRRPPRSTRTDTLFPYTTLFRARTVASLFCLPWRLAPDRLVMTRSPTTPPVRISSLHRGHNHSHSHSHTRYASPDLCSGLLQAPCRSPLADSSPRSLCRARRPALILLLTPHLLPSSLSPFFVVSSSILSFLFFLFFFLFFFLLIFFFF